MAEPTNQPQPSSDETTFDLLKSDDNDVIEDTLGGEGDLLSNKDNKDDKELEAKSPDAKKDDDDEIELEDEDEEIKPIDDKFGLIAPPRRKEILAAFPELFKKFPYIEQSMYREKAYTDTLGTVEDAREAVDKAKKFDDINEKLTTGNVEAILESVNKEKFGDVVDGLMPALFKKDPNAFYHIASGFAKSTISQMLAEAQSTKDEEMYKAAVAVHKYIFGNTQFTAHGRYGAAANPNETKELTEIQKREKDFQDRVAETHKTEVKSRIDNQIKSTINANIDKNNEMTDYIKRNATRDALDTVNSLLEQDTRFQLLINKAWEKAAKADFPKKDIDEIKSAYASKARTILSEVIRNSRNAALKGMGKQVRERVVKEDTSSNRESNRVVVPPNNNNRSKNPSEGISTLDYLNSD